MNENSINYHEKYEKMTLNNESLKRQCAYNTYYTMGIYLITYLF